MNKVLVCMAIVLSALSVRAQTGDSVDNQIMSLEQKWAQYQKASDAGIR